MKKFGVTLLPFSSHLERDAYIRFIRAKDLTHARKLAYKKFLSGMCSPRIVSIWEV